MRVPLSWLREYVDIQLTPEQLAERLTLLGMEVKGIEQWGADWRSVVVGELLTVEKHPYADRLHLTTVNIGSGEPLHIVCGAHNIAPGQRVPVALPGAVLPGDRRIERTEKMGIASEGMLCSGDELRITSDAEGILILPPDTPLGGQLSDLYGDVVLDVDVKPNRGDALCLIGLAREVAAATGATIRWPEIAVEEAGGPVTRSAPSRGPRAGAVHPLRRPLDQRREDRPLAGPGPDAAPGGRHAARQQRRRRVQLRHARAGQADPHLRRGRGPRRQDHRPACARRGAARNPGPRRSRADRRHVDHRRPSGPHRHRRGHGRRRQRDHRLDDRDRHRVGHLRPGQHPPHGSALRPALRRRACASRRARSSGWPGSAPTGWPSWSRPGPAARSPRVGWTPPRSSPASAGRVPPRRGSTACSARTSPRTSSGTSSPVSASRPSRAAGGEAIQSRRRPDRSTVRRSPGPPRPRSCRPGGATSRSRPTWRRRSPASAATRRSRAACRTRRCRRIVTSRSNCGISSATRSPAPA